MIRRRAEIILPSKGVRHLCPLNIESVYRFMRSSVSGLIRWL